ncbi:Dicer-like protein 2 [Exophiala xenobiotica]|nr:Dicer-like protein 2 [Exophiala xenobiotica]
MPRVESSVNSPLDVNDLAFGKFSSPGNDATVAHVRKQIQAFSRTYDHLRHQLGSWACYEYLTLVRWRLLQATDRQQELIFQSEQINNVAYLNAIEFIATRAGPQTLGHTAKVARMIAYLDERAKRPFTAIIFVEQRATAIILSRLLQRLLVNRGLSTASFVGTSNCSSRPSQLKDITDFGAQKNVLQEFRDGKVRLLISTTVLEEGIDISSCNLIISFDPPLNVKSFIQRRGRARDRESEFVMLVTAGDPNAKLDEWRRGEELMLDIARTERDRCAQLQRLEADLAESQTQRLEVAETGALLTPDRAPNYLQHFCSRLPRDAFCDHLPTYRYYEDDCGLVQALVVLPGALDDSVREHRGSSYWRTEKAARRDAAYQAYLHLYHAGLVDNHLLPTPRLDQDVTVEIPVVPSRIQIPPLHDVWQDEARAREVKGLGSLGLISLQIKRPKQSKLRVLLMLTTPLTTSIPSCLLHWTTDELWHADFCFLERDVALTYDLALQVQHCTEILCSGSSSQQNVSHRTGAIVLLSPTLDPEGLVEWIEKNSGCVSAIDAQRRGPPYGLVRSRATPHRLHIVEKWQDNGSLAVALLPRRRNFLRQSLVHAATPSSSADQRSRQTNNESELVIPVQEATLDNLNSEAVYLSILLPSLFHHIQNTLLAWHLSQHVLHSVTLVDMSLLLEALSAPCAGEPVNYQRLEFIGDSVLKFLVSLQLFLTRPGWHEGYLTLVRKSWVCNKTLAHAACQCGLGAYVITAAFSPRRWKPLYLDSWDNIVDAHERTVSMKLLADVVEAVVGAAFVEGGLFRAAECTAIFLPQLEKSTFGDPLRLSTHYSQELMVGANGRSILNDLQVLIQYQFHRLGLLQEAITHPSCLRLTTGCSYQRLEFVGDAVLDLLVVRALIPYKDKLSHVRMHLIKSTLVNSYSLGFWCMNLAANQGRQEVGQDRESGDYVVRMETRQVSLCHFLQFDNSKMAEVRSACEQRLESLAPDISVHLATGVAYPWAQMVYVGAPKFASDMIESILGAIYLDSDGDLDTCWDFLRTLGLTTYFARLVDEDVELRHPKNILSSRMTKKVRYHFGRANEQPEELQCHAEADGIRFPSVVGGISREDLTTRAAEAALRTMDIDMISN